MKRFQEKVKCNSLGLVLSLISLLSWLGLSDKRLIKFKMSIGIGFLILKGTLTADAQDMNLYRKATCYYNIGGPMPWEGRQFNIGLSASYRNGVNQFELKAGHYFRPVYAGLSVKYMTPKVEHPGFYPGVYVRYSPRMLFFSWSNIPIGVVMEANYHFSENAFQNSGEPIPQSVGVVTGICTIFGVGDPFCCGVELSLEHEMMIYNATVTDYYYPVLRFNYYFKVYGKRDWVF